jgi:hypothetical protein
MPGPTLQNWNRSPNSTSFNTLGFETVGPVNITATATANTVIQAGMIFPELYKIRKVGVFFTSAPSVTATTSFNLVVGTAAYTQGVIAPTDNSFASGTVAGNPTLGTTNGAGVAVAGNGFGYPTNVAVAGMAVFSADVTFLPGTQQAGVYTNSTYAPGWITTAATNGYGVFVPPNYDAVYPMLVPLTLRVTTPGTGNLTNFFVTLLIEPVTPLANPGSGGPGQIAYAIPGVSF